MLNTFHLDDLHPEPPHDLENFDAVMERDRVLDLIHMERPGTDELDFLCSTLALLDDGSLQLHMEG